MPLNTGYLTAKTDKASDEEFSKYVQVFKTLPYVKLIYTHIDSGQNFFFYEPEEEYDVIISNPPFSCKDDVLKRLFELEKPYAMLLLDIKQC